MIEVTKMFSHYNFCKIETTFQCLQGFQRVKVDEGVKLRRSPKHLPDNFVIGFSAATSARMCAPGTGFRNPTASRFSFQVLI